MIQQSTHDKDCGKQGFTNTDFMTKINSQQTKTKTLINESRDVCRARLKSGEPLITVHKKSAAPRAN